MYIEIADFITAEEHADLISIANSGTFVDGLETAKNFSHQTKNNEQLKPTSEESSKIDSIIKSAFERNVEIQAFTQAREVRAPMLSRYQPGMYYKQHLDASHMNTGGNGMRTDLSMTLFLSDPETYEGGELVLQTDFGDIDCKPAARTAVVYSTLLWHEVETVTQGQRLAIVSWFNSRIRDPQHRSLLFEITMAWREVTAAAPESEAAKRLHKSYMNLTKLWSEG